ncbi:MAG: LysR substrate-binding domain-containing protein [Parvularculaceae bacterium]
MQGLLNKAIKALLLHNVGLRIHLEATSVAAGVLALRRGDIDVLVGPENAMKGRRPSPMKLGDLETSLFTRKTHPLVLKTNVHKEEIAEYPVIAADRLSWHTDRLRSLYENTGGDSARRMHIMEYFPLVADIVADSDAIGVIGAEYSTSKTFMSRFSLLNIDLFEPLPVGFSVRKRWLPSPAVRAFEAALREFPPGA